MNKKDQVSLQRVLRSRRETLFREVARTEEDLRFIAEDRESELEERAQEERAAVLFDRLDRRGKRAIEDIDAALGRMADGSYGTCLGCGGRVAMARLKALPAAALCIDCARAGEVGVAPSVEAETEVVLEGPLPAALSTLTDREITAALREQVAADGRIDMEELRIVCRHGVVHLDGALPSETEHQILVKLVTDVAGLQEVVDHVTVEELLWNRAERAPGTSASDLAEEARGEASETEDPVKSAEEGIDFVPPDEPPAEPEK